jgi:hypothetical protein
VGVLKEVQGVGELVAGIPPGAKFERRRQISAVFADERRVLGERGSGTVR